MPLQSFDPLVREWFENHFKTVTEPQAIGWPQIRSGGDVLISAPTGSGKTLASILTAVRTGDTPASERLKMGKQAPHILVTTPESLYILLTSVGGRKMLSAVRTLIVDEIHAVADDKRGSHLALSIARLEALVGAPLQKIGLSATVSPIEEVARFLSDQAHIVQVGHRRAMDIAVEVPRDELGAVA